MDLYARVTWLNVEIPITGMEAVAIQNVAHSTHSLVEIVQTVAAIRVDWLNLELPAPTGVYAEILANIGVSTPTILEDFIIPPPPPITPGGDTAVVELISGPRAFVGAPRRIREILNHAQTSSQDVGDQVRGPIHEVLEHESRNLPAFRATIRRFLGVATPEFEYNQIDELIPDFPPELVITSEDSPRTRLRKKRQQEEFIMVLEDLV